MIQISSVPTSLRPIFVKFQMPKGVEKCAKTVFTYIFLEETKDNFGRVMEFVTVRFVFLRVVLRYAVLRQFKSGQCVTV